MAEAAYRNLGSDPKTIAVASAALVASFAAMVTAAYTADHIEKAGVKLADNEKLHQAYRTAWTSAVISSVGVAGSAAALVFLLRKK